MEVWKLKQHCLMYSFITFHGILSLTTANLNKQLDQNVFFSVEPSFLTFKVFFDQNVPIFLIIYKKMSK